MPARLVQRTCLDDARELLVGRQFPVREVVAVDADSILYLTHKGEPRTAWLHREDEKTLRIRTEPGFSSTPPEGLHDPGESPAQGWA